MRTNHITHTAARPPRGSRQITLSLNTLSLVPDPLGVEDFVSAVLEAYNRLSKHGGIIIWR